MSSKDRFIEQIMKTVPNNATQQLIDQATRVHKSHSAFQYLIDTQTKAYNSIPRYVVDAAIKAMSGSAMRVIDEVSKNSMKPQHLQIIGKLAIPNINLQAAEIIRRSVIFPADILQNQAVQAVVKSAQVMRGATVERVIETLNKQTGTIDYDRLGAIAGSATLAAFRSAMPEVLQAINSMFAGQVADYLRQALEQRDEQAFARVEKLIDDKLASLPNNRVATEGLWIIILQILIALLSLSTDFYQVYDNNQISKIQATQHAELKEFLGRIANNTEHHVPEKDVSIYYVVQRPVDLKLKPRCKSASIATITRNQKVRLVQMNHQWIYVEYFDYLEGVPKYGWASKKYFVRVKD